MSSHSEGNEHDTAQRLRREAEARLADTGPASDAGCSPEEILHELRVHQIELTMQNEALLQTQLALEESRDHYLDLYEFAPVGYLTLDGEQRVESLNLTASTLLGQSRQSVLHRGFSHLVAAEDRGRWGPLFEEMMQHPGEPQRADLTLRRGTESAFRARLHGVWSGRGARTDRALVALSDVSVEARQARSLRESSDFLDAVMQSVGSAIAVVDPSGRIVRVNRAASLISGFAADELVGRPLPPAAAPGARGVLAACFAKAMNEGEATFGLEFPFAAKNGERRVLLVDTVPLRIDGRISGVVASGQDITDRKQLEQRVRRLADYDPLTDLRNRRPFYDSISAAIAHARRKRTRLAVLYLDLDRFKAINDNLGHEAGDELLAETAARLKSCIRRSDIAARVGGDEFNVLLTDVSRGEGAADAARQILAAWSKPFRLAGETVLMTTSIGISVYPGDGEDADTLVAHADIAMYEAKRSGGATFRFFDPQINQRASERMALEHQLRIALDQQQLEVLYQPQVQLASHRIVGAEALLRWHHPTRGTLGPAQFMSVAEESGLIVPIGEWVLRTACRQARRWRDRMSAGFTMVVNLSARQFRQPGLAGSTCGALRDAQLPPENLTLDISESTVMDNPEESSVRLAELAQCGIGLSLDNFGSGRSSLTRLNKMPFVHVKIDRSVVESVGRDSDDGSVIKAMIALSHDLHIAVVAQGVETDEQLAVLASNHCDEALGLLIGPPVPAAAMESLLPM